MLAMLCWKNAFVIPTEPDTKTDPVQEKLDQTASLLNDLQQTQSERLSSKLPAHLALVSGPSEKEIQLGKGYLTQAISISTSCANILIYILEFKLLMNDECIMSCC